ncbi:MAG: hypothetical protein ACXVA9_11350 [Bdellovibrionales bacterium]
MRIAALYLLLLTVASQAHAFGKTGRSYLPSPVLIQALSLTGAAGGTSPVTVAATGSGNLLVVAADFFVGSNCITGITDNGSSGGNTYNLIPNTSQNNSNAGNVAMFYATNSKSGATTVTVANTCSGNSTIFFLEFSNLTALDGTPASNSVTSNSTLITAPTITTTTNRSVVVSVGIAGGTISGLHTGSAFTPLAVLAGDQVGYLKTNAPGSYGALFDQSPTNWSCAATAAFK